MIGFENPVVLFGFVLCCAVIVGSFVLLAIKEWIDKRHAEHDKAEKAKNKTSTNK